MFRNKKSWNWLSSLMALIMGLSLFLTFMPTKPVAAAATTSVTITKYDAHGNVIGIPLTITWEQMRDHYMGFPSYGDGIIHYYCEGPNFDPARTFETLWDPTETGNIDSRDYGAAKGTDVKDLCNLAGGAEPGDTITTRAPDGFTKVWDYENVYNPDPRMGRLVLTWYTWGAAEGHNGYIPDYDTGMRLLFFTDITDTGLPSGRHVFGDYDEYLTMPQNRWYCYYDGQFWPTTSGLSVKWVSNIDIRQPNMVSCDASGNTKENFVPSETVYVKGLGLKASTSYKLWLQPEPAVWFSQAHGDTVPGFSPPAPLSTANDPSGSQETVTTNGSGDFPPTAIWTIPSSATAQKYDIVADNQAGGSNVGKFDSNDGCDSAGFQGLSVITPPIAAFTSDVQSGTAPLTVHFTDQSTNSPTSWAWDFDNNGTTDSTDQNPFYIYTTAGTYSVKLTATNTYGSDDEIKTDYITVNPAPVAPTAAFTATPTSGTAPLEVHFTDQSTGSPTSWAWDFDNNGTTDSIEQNPIHTYSSAGTYTVKLTATNAIGSDDETKTNYITVNTASSKPAWDLNGDHVCDIGDVVVVGLKWGLTGSPGWIPEDLSIDGIIDIGDVVILGLHWNQTW